MKVFVWTYLRSQQSLAAVAVKANMSKVTGKTVQFFHTEYLTAYKKQCNCKCFCL